MTGERLLEYLPDSNISRYAKHEAIYFQGEPATRVYLVMEGKVKVLCHESLRVVVDVYQSDELFGESALAGHEHRMEQAVAMEPTRLMSWTRDEIEEEAATSPELALALIRFAAFRSLEFAIRIESFSCEKIERRLTRALVRFAARLGWDAGDGTVKMDALTHEFLGQYVGTSREIVTQYMNQLRRAGYLKYSRNGITLQPRALAAWQTDPATIALRRSASPAS
jgi:CRP/FNR family cyclic AMP-dependent transcriptional regulator